MTKNQQSLIIVMGISGTGKSTIAKQLAEHLSYSYVEADSFHSQHAKTLMSQNRALTEQIRLPWINRICRELILRASQHENVVLAYSGLKLKHRNKFRELGFNVCFICLQGASALIKTRITQRQAHFVSADFVDSQLACFESPTADETDIYFIDVNQPISEIVTQALAIYQRCKNKDLP